MFLTRNAKALQVQRLAWIMLTLFYSANLTYAHNFNREESYSDYILCRHCGADVADAGYIFHHYSPSSTIKGDQTVFQKKHVDVQMFKNSRGVEFEIITVHKSNCIGVPVPFSESWRAEHLWYPEYDWQTCVCPVCGELVGWEFNPVISPLDPPRITPLKRFYGIILETTISEKYSDSLVIIPTSY